MNGNKFNRRKVLKRIASTGAVGLGMGSIGSVSGAEDANMEYKQIKGQKRSELITQALSNSAVTAIADELNKDGFTFSRSESKVFLVRNLEENIKEYAATLTYTSKSTEHNGYISWTTDNDIDTGGVQLLSNIDALDNEHIDYIQYQYSNGKVSVEKNERGSGTTRAASNEVHTNVTSPPYYVCDGNVDISCVISKAFLAGVAGKTFCTACGSGALPSCAICAGVIIASTERTLDACCEGEWVNCGGFCQEHHPACEICGGG